MDPAARLAWSSFAMSFFDAAAVSLDYTGLDPAATYEAVVVFNANAEPAARVEGRGAPRQGGAGAARRVSHCHFAPPFPVPIEIRHNR